MGIYERKNESIGNPIFKYLTIFILLVLFSVPLAFTESGVNLGSAGDYIILSKTGISTTGTTHISGNIGVSPISATAITGFGALPLDSSGQFSTSSLVNGKIYAADYTEPTPTKLNTAISNMEAAYIDALSRPTSVLNAGNGAGEIGGLTLAPGVYTFTGDSINVLISTDLTLNGNSNDVWIFQIPGTFNLANGIKVNLSGGALAKNIFWAVTGATTLGTNSVLEGTVLDATSIAIQTNATLNGNALAQTAVTLQSNIVNDTTLPIITRIGNDVNVDFNSIYMDDSATAIDNVDGDLTPLIITVNDVNTLYLGSYIVTYNVSDLTGNKAVQVTRTINVIDSNKPLIILNGSDLNVEINSTYVDAGAIAFDDVDGNLTSSIVTVNSVNTLVLGTYTVTYNVNDLSGNKAIQVTRIVNVIHSVVLDVTPPVITLLGSSIITITINSAYIDAGATAYDNIDGNLTNLIVIVNPVNTSILGTYTITYDVNDSCDNNAVQVKRIVVVVPDFNLTTNPIIPNQKAWFNEPVGVSFSYDENTQIRYCRSDGINNTSCLKLNPDWNSTNGLRKFIPKVAQDYNIYSTSLIFSNDGNNSIKYFVISDDQNINDFNVMNVLVHYIAIDKTAPTQQMFYTVAYAPDSYRGISMNTSYPYPITTTSGLILAKLSLTSSGPDSLSGINYCQVNFDYNFDNNNWGARLNQEEIMNLSHQYNTIGEKVIAVFCIDNADNNTMWLSSSVPVYHVTVVDINVPVMVDLNAIVINNNIRLDFSATDINGLGIKGYYVSQNQNNWIYTTDTNYLSTLANGTYVFFVKATDFGDNNSVDKNITVVVNYTPPSSGGGSSGGGGTYFPTCTSYKYSDWNVCSANGTQTRTVISRVPTWCRGTPILTQSCNTTTEEPTIPVIPTIKPLIQPTAPKETLPVTTIAPAEEVPNETNKLFNLGTDLVLLGLLAFALILFVVGVGKIIRTGQNNKADEEERLAEDKKIKNK